MNIDLTKNIELNHKNDIQVNEFDEEKLFNIQNLILSAFNISKIFETKVENKSNKFENLDLKDKSISNENHYMVLFIFIESYIIIDFEFLKNILGIGKQQS